MTGLLLAALFLEIGLALIVLPWTSYWDRNLFVDMLPALKEALASNVLRGAVSGLGVVNLAAGGAELLGLLRRRSHETPDGPGVPRVTDV